MDQVSNRYIPWEIIKFILLWSPAKSLGRFKSVSKEWNSVISDPLFIKTHTHRLFHQPKPTKKLITLSRTTRIRWNPLISLPRFIKSHAHQILHQPKPTMKLLALTSSTSSSPKSLYSIELNIVNNNYTILATAKQITLGSPPPMQCNEIMGSCNGLVLATVRTSLQDPWALFLINPTTLDHCKLPVNPFADYPGVRYARYGFGYDSSTDDYKVVSVRTSYGPSIFYSIVSIYIVSIYSLRDNSWRELPITPHHVDHNGGCALVNGYCHWLSTSSESIIAFSFVDELFSQIKPPDSVLNPKWYTRRVVEIGGRLGVYLFPWDTSGDYVLWVMQEYGDAKSWTRVFSHKDYMRPLCMLQGSDRVIVFYDGKEDGVGLLNIDEGRRIKILTGPVKFNSIGYAFVESIESPKRISTKVMDN